MGLSQEDVIHGLWRDRAKLLAYIGAIVLNEHHDLAEDIYQDVVVLALKKAGEIESQEHLFGWARKAAKYKAIDYLRRNKLQPKHLSPDVLDLMEQEWEEAWKSASPSMIGALRACLKNLTPRARKLIDLRYGDQLDGTSISQILGIKVQSIYMALSRIYRTLEECIRRKNAAGSGDHG
jgi:RNA polymerase sigma-70 factor (ECF subfamily)